MLIARPLTAIELTFLRRHHAATQAFAVYASVAEELGSATVAAADRALRAAYPVLARAVLADACAFDEASGPAELRSSSGTAQSFRSLVLRELELPFPPDRPAYRWLLIRHEHGSTLALVCHPAALDGFSAITMLMAALRQPAVAEPGGEPPLIRSPAQGAEATRVGGVSLVLGEEETQRLVADARARSLSLHSVLAASLVAAGGPELGMDEAGGAIASRVDLRRFAPPAEKAMPGQLVGEVETHLGLATSHAEQVAAHLRELSYDDILAGTLASAHASRCVLSTSPSIARVQRPSGAQVVEMGGLQCADADRTLKVSAAIYDGRLRCNMGFRRAALGVPQALALAARCGRALGSADGDLQVW